MFNSKNGIGGHLEDAADAWAILAWSGNPEVAPLSPTGAPRVTDDPEVLSITISPIPDEVYSMINVGPAGRTAYDTTFVKHKNAWASSHSDRNWLVLKSCDVPFDITALNFFKRFDFCHSISLIILASILLCRIRVTVTLHMLEALQIFERISHQASTTTCVAIATCAIKKLLLWKLRQRAVLDLISSFNRASSWEGIASSTASLISYCVQDSLLSPVDRWSVTLKSTPFLFFFSSLIFLAIFSCLIIFIIEEFIWLDRWIYPKALHSLEFLKRHIGKLIDANFKSCSLGVVSFH